MKNKLLHIGAIAVLSLTSISCGKNGLNVFSIEDDKQLGLQTKNQIESDPANYPILNPATHSTAYAYLNAIKDDILASGQIRYKDEFAWEVKIIKDDNVQNAFCTPGGYIYVYTGLIKYLDDKSSLAGVMGHEMAHADRRHSTTQMTKAYGVQTMLDVVLGKNQSMLTQIGAELVTLRFSRDDESEADKYSVKYLCPTKYKADGASYFFQKIIDQGGSSTPAFLSTHPNPDNRVENIQKEARAEGCVSSISNEEEIISYNQFKNML
jgi:predicted Zn-dependent protease